RKPLVIKNAWNCFRIPALARLLPAARFLWVRRDIGTAAKSDLHARYSTKGSPVIWNSATPHNVESLRARPYWEQVVENQFEFNAAMHRDLNAHAKERFLEVWYEDLCADPSFTLDRIARTWGDLGSASGGPSTIGVKRSAERWDLTVEDSSR